MSALAPQGCQATVVIPVHNAEDHLSFQLEALAGQTTSRDFEVIVVLNRCSDRSEQIAQAYAEALDLVILKRDDSPSAAYARNEGAACARSELILFCDADDRVCPEWVDSMCNALAGADFVGGRICVDKSKLPSWAFCRFYADLDGESLVFRDRRIRYPISASLGVRSAAFSSVGGFDASFPGAAAEETDLAIRLLRSGCRVGDAPGASLSYTPRVRLREILRQQRAYAFGRARVNSAELIEVPLLRPITAARLAVRAVGRLVVREQVWHPAALISEIAVHYFAYRAGQEMARNPPRPFDDGDRDSLDFVVPIGTALIGGLGLLARRPGARWYAGDGTERVSLALVTHLVNEGDRFVDVGSNIGTYTLAAAIAVGSTGSVQAFEPDSRANVLLQRNVMRHGLQGRVTIHGQAVGAEAGTMGIIRYENDLLSGAAASASAFSPGESLDVVDVAVVTIDDFGFGSIGMMKIDVEGFELEALSGSRRTIERSPDLALLVELNPAAQAAAGHGTDELLDVLESNGRCGWIVEEAVSGRAAVVRELNHATRAEIRTADPAWYGNVLSVPAHRRTDVERAIDRVLAGL